MKPDYNAIASDVLLMGRLSMTERRVVFRAGKTLDDVRHACTKAKKNGRSKTEFELSMLAVYLKAVFKAAPK